MKGTSLVNTPADTPMIDPRMFFEEKYGLFLKNSYPDDRATFLAIVIADLCDHPITRDIVGRFQIREWAGHSWHRIRAKIVNPNTGANVEQFLAKHGGGSTFTIEELVDRLLRAVERRSELEAELAVLNRVLVHLERGGAV